MDLPVLLLGWLLLFPSLSSAASLSSSCGGRRRLVVRKGERAFWRSRGEGAVFFPVASDSSLTRGWYSSDCSAKCSTCSTCELSTRFMAP